MNYDASYISEKLIYNKDIITSLYFRQGVWFYNNITNFHYSYILYTPLQGFHEIGVITKLVVDREQSSGLSAIDTEFSLRIVDIKASIKARAGPKPAPPLTIPIESEIRADESYVEDDTENNIYWNAEFEVCGFVLS